MEDCGSESRYIDILAMHSPALLEFDYYKMWSVVFFVY